jgi:hypothetical protein
MTAERRNSQEIARAPLLAFMGEVKTWTAIEVQQELEDRMQAIRDHQYETMLRETDMKEFLRDLLWNRPAAFRFIEVWRRMYPRTNRHPGNAHYGLGHYRKFVIREFSRRYVGCLEEE